MRISLLTVGSRGDVQPFVGFARHLRSLGHEPTLVTHAPFADLAGRHGVPFRPVHGDPQEVVGSPEGQRLLATRRPIQLARRFVEVLRPHWELFVDEAEAATADADMIVYSPLAFVGFHIAESRELPSALATFQPLTPTGMFPVVPMGGRNLGAIGNRAAHRAMQQATWQLMRPFVNDYRHRLGLPAEARMGPYRRFVADGEPHLYAYSRHLGPVAPDWPASVHVTGAWHTPTPDDFTPDAELVAFLADGPPPVCAGLGSMQDADDQVRAEVILAACRAAGRRMVIQTGWGGIAAVDGDDVHVIAGTDHPWLFPRCHAVIHHGGAGTTHTAAAAGVPSVVIPFFADQPFWAHHVQRVGAGVGPLPKAGLTVEDVAAALALVSGSRIRAATGRLAGRMAAEDGMVRAVDALGLSDT